MSVSRAADIAKFDRMSGLINQQNDLEASVTDVSSQIKSMKIADYKTKYGSITEGLKAYKADFAALTDMVETLNKSISDLAAQIDAVRTEKNNQMTRMIAAKRRELLAM